MPILVVTKSFNKLKLTKWIFNNQEAIPMTVENHMGLAINISCKLKWHYNNHGIMLLVFLKYMRYAYLLDVGPFVVYCYGFEDLCFCTIITCLFYYEKFLEHWF